MVTKIYHNLIRFSKLPTMRYEFFDFLLACQGNNYDQLNIFIRKMVTDRSKFQPLERSMDGILKFLGVMVVGAIVLALLAGLGPFWAIIAFLIVGAAVVGKGKNDKKCSMHGFYFKTSNQINNFRWPIHCLGSGQRRL